MFGKFGLLILVGVALSMATRSDRIYKISQDEQDLFVNPAKSCKSCLNIAPQSRDLPVEVFQVLDLPLSIHEAALVKSYKSFLLKISLGNSSDVKLIGLRYSLAIIDSKNQAQLLANRTEGFAIPPYDTTTMTFKTPIKFKPRDGERLVLMVEQIVSRESIWEVVKAKDALEAYARGDYSVMPTVMRVANAVDSPPGEPQPVRFRKN
jgi:hypothetical protein